MQRRLFHISSTAALTLLGFVPSISFAQKASTPMATVLVSGHRVEQTSFDLPAAVDVVNAERILDGQLRVNASEALASVPGLVARDRQNYAQDLQISSRGFGARSAFGVRGVRLITDGIPATMPDGQGQAATFNLDMAERIEVMRGPFSALYGNHAGGVIQLFTRTPKGAPAIETRVAAGSDGVRKFDLNAEGSAGPVAYLLDFSRFETDGYRHHSAATRNQGYAKLATRPSSDSRLTVVANILHQPDTEDPLGATWSTFQRNPRAGEIDPNDTQVPKRSFAQRYDTRKSVDHGQVGLHYEQRFGPNRLQASVYAGTRQVIQFQSFSKAFQQSASHSGGVIDFDRDFHGFDINWQDQRALYGGTLRTTVGIEYGSASDKRRGFENFAGDELGVKGRLRRDETDDVASLAPYLQAEWERGRWALTAGLRHTRLDVDVRDRFLANGDDSGGTGFRRTTPLLAVLYKVTPQLNLYASAARGFETPTLNELFYSSTAGGFNFGLRPATSLHLEAGAKAMIGERLRIDAALFQARTHDELVVDTASGGRTSYRNAAETLRQGLELSMDASFDHGWNARVAATLLRAVYDESFGKVPQGSRLPGVPRATLYGELGWKDSTGRFGAALESVASSKAWPDDANAAQPAPGYAVLNARGQAQQQLGPWRLRQFIRVNNLLDRTYVGSLIVGEANQRYYEAAPGRNWIAGFSAQYLFR